MSDDRSGVDDGAAGFVIGKLTGALALTILLRSRIDAME